MSSSPSFEDDAIISYGHIDNEPVEDEEKGWVDAFHERLFKRLGQRLGYRPAVWRDPRLPGNVNFAYVLADRIGKARVLVSILSPAYLQSPWCMGELDAFCKIAEEQGGLKTGGGRFRVFKVVKTFVEREDHPPVFQGQLGYEFYEEDEAGRPVEFGQGLGKNYDQRYWTRLDELTWDIQKTLEELKPRRATAAPAPLGGVAPASKGTVYLAVSTGDLRAERDRVKFELLDRGFTVLPEGELPATSPEFETAVREAVGRARLSVHLIGARYGMVPEGAKGSSIVKLQNEIAAERSGEAGFARVIWMPERLQPSEDEQAQFIEYLRTDGQAQRGAELLQTTLEELKSVIQARLSASTNGHRPAATPAGGGRKVYLVCDQADQEGIIPLYKSLARRGYKVSVPLFKGDAGKAAERHRENLRRCDAVLVYYGNAEQDWFDGVMQELDDVPAAERAGPPLARGVYVAAPADFYKELYESNDAFWAWRGGAVRASARGGEALQGVHREGRRQPRDAPPRRVGRGVRDNRGAVRGGRRGRRGLPAPRPLLPHAARQRPARRRFACRHLAREPDTQLGAAAEVGGRGGAVGAHLPPPRRDGRAAQGGRRGPAQRPGAASGARLARAEQAQRDVGAPLPPRVRDGDELPRRERRGARG